MRRLELVADEKRLVLVVLSLEPMQRGVGDGGGGIGGFATPPGEAEQNKRFYDIRYPVKDIPQEKEVWTYLLWRFVVMLK